MHTTTVRHLAASVLLAVFSLPAGATPPADPAEPANLHVSTDGLDLTKAADQALLRHRVATAAHKVCEQVTHGNSITDPGYEACFENAVRTARRDVDARVAAARASNQVASGAAK